MSPSLRERLLTNKAELLRYLERRERSIEMVVATFGRLADAYPPGCSLSAPEWRVHEQAIDEAYLLACETGDLEPLRTALAVYERFALVRFDTHSRHKA